MNYASQVIIAVTAVILLGAAAGVASFLPMMFLLLPIVAVPVLFLAYLLYRNYRDLAALKSESLAIPRLNEAYPEMAMNSLEGSGEQKADIYENERNFDMKNVMTPAEQIEQIEMHELRMLFEYMPIGHIEHKFIEDNEGRWHFTFQLHSPLTHFQASGDGADPMSAFQEAKRMLKKQIRVWHHDRTTTDRMLENTLGDVAAIKAMSHKGDKKHPKVLIVEDDIDMAMATASAFKALGCDTVISNGKDGAHQKMSFSDIDFVVLDWILDDDLSAGQLVEKSSRIIDAFTELREKFKKHQTKVVTLSALNRSEVHLPKNEFFTHVGHWKKPVQYSDLSGRASELLAANGY